MKRKIVLVTERDFLKKCRLDFGNIKQLVKQNKCAKYVF